MRRTQHNRTATIVVMAACLAMLSGCAPGGAIEGEVQGDVSTELTTDDVTLTLYDGVGFPLSPALAEEFERQHPNVTIKVVQEPDATLIAEAPRLMASDSAPDLMRVDIFVDQVQDGLLANLDPYAEAYGWDQFPASQLAPLRVDADGRKGVGSLWGLGAQYGLTGVYFNRELGAQIGMTEPPATLDELEGWLEKAKAAGIQPIANGNQSGSANFIYQAIVNAYVEPSVIEDWVWHKPGATIDLPGVHEGTERFARWADEGYLPPGSASIEYTPQVDNFIQGGGLFLFLGDWEAANLDAQMGANVGFFLAPPLEAGGQHRAMSGPANFVIPAKSKNRDTAAFFLNWTLTDPTARQLIVDVAGSSVGGDPSLPAPALKEGSVVTATVEAYNQLARENGAVPFVVDATPGMAQVTFVPSSQELIAGRITPDEFVARLQAAYEEDLSN
jgi:ABC-type glycerol-3-phosphate transport system substrate-binding protein